MKVYLAARYSRRVEILGYAEELRAAGHEVTSRWLNGSHQISTTGAPLGDAGEALVEGDDGGMSEKAKRLRAGFVQEDVTDMLAASVIVSFTEPPRTVHNRGGRHVEFGFCLGFNWASRRLDNSLEYRLIVVGYRENLFHYLPEVEFYATWEEARAALHSRNLHRHRRDEVLAEDVSQAPRRLCDHAPRNEGRGHGGTEPAFRPGDSGT